jgi:methylglutamate dehydrogenase subunit B
MSFHIECPNCGSRTQDEFWFGGEPRLDVPEASPQRVYEAAWLSANVAGPTQERWFHFAGCRRWLTVRRDTRTNEVLDVEAGGESSISAGPSTESEAGTTARHRPPRA